MKNLTVKLLLLIFLAAVAGCDRVASVQPLGIATQAAGGGINFPAATLEETKAPVLMITQETDATSKDTEIDSPTSQATEEVSASATPAATAVPQATNTAAPIATNVPPTVVPQFTLEAPAVYVLKNGEWAVCIARRYNLNLDAFFALNHISMQTNYLPVGTSLKLPVGGSWSTQYGPRYWHAHPDSYTVKANDSINKIACYYGDIAPSAIETANGLSGAYSLSAGQKLNIP